MTIRAFQVQVTIDYLDLRPRLAEPESQIELKFQTMFKNSRITAKIMSEALMTKTYLAK